MTVDYILSAKYVVTANAQMEVLHDTAVVVAGGRIIDILSPQDALRRYSSNSVINSDVLMPGFVNCHCHAAMVYFRGLADDLPLNKWLQEYIWPSEAKWLSPEFVSDATMLASAEMLKAGITTVADLYFFADAIAKVYKQVGMRAVVCSGVIDFETPSGTCVSDYLDRALELYQTWHKDTLIRPSVVAHSIYTCSTDTLKQVRAFADKHGIMPHIHLSETTWEVEMAQSKYNCRPVRYLQKIGFLHDGVVASHCVHLDDDEIELLATNDVHVVHCIDSNLKLASGFAPVAKMLKAGITVALGTDGVASNNDLDILAEASLTAKVQKALFNDPIALDAKTAFAMATIRGAQALGISHLTGSIEVGKRADLITASLDNVRLMPMYDIYSHIIYCMHSCDIKDVMVDGRLLIDNRQLLSISEDEVKYKAQLWQQKIKQGV